jgi:wyosine [tRNA(Phe)-imidazoG37] synthetase (radical SAM superfamily)
MNHIYGPVPSRRLGLSLGLDIIPYKTCSFNCIYCQLGRTIKKTIERKEYVEVDEIINELKNTLSLNQKIEYITFSGSGEPTLNIGIGKMIKRIKSITNIPVVVLTNSSLLFYDDVRKDLLNADVIVPSLDAGTEKTFKKINRPHNLIKFDKIIEGLEKLRKEYKNKIWLEIMLVKGINDNINELKELIHIVNTLQPDKVHLNTPVRPPAEKFVKPLSLHELNKIKKIIGKCEIISSYHKNDKIYEDKIQKNIKNKILEIVKRRPVTINDISNSLGINESIAIKYVLELKKENKIGKKKYKNCIFFYV